MSNLLNYILVFTIVFSNILLALLVFVKNKKEPKNIFFYCLALAVALWNLSAFFADIGSSYEIRLLLSKLSYLFSFVASYFAVMFSYEFITSKTNKLIGILNSTACIMISLLLVFTNLIVGGITAEPVNFTINNGPLSFTLWFIVILYIFQLIYVPLINYKKADNLKRNQIKFVFFGFILFSLLVFFFNFIVKGITGSDAYYKYGNYSALILVASISYALIRHRLMDIRMVVARSVAYTVLIATMAGFYAGMVVGIERLFFPSEVAGFNWTIGIIRTLLAVIMAFSFQPLRKWITKVTDKIFFKNQYDPEQFLDTLAHTIGGTIVLIELVYQALNLIRTQMKITRGIFVVLNDNGTINDFQAFGYEKATKPETEDMGKLAKDGILLYDDLEETSRYKHILRKYDVSAAIPLKTENTVEGILLLGEKESGDMYSEGDMKVFEIIAPEIAVAITNAKAYEKIDRFNVTLRQEIKKATHELERKNEQLRELDKAKDEFISMASHQLRTPLTAIKGYLSMLLEGDAGEIRVSQYDFVNEAFNGANRMVGLINDLLNVSRMETGRFFLEPVDVDMVKVVNEEMKQLSEHAKEKKLFFKFDQKKKNIPHIMADETKIHQVVMNFMDNALYYTTEGGVTVGLDADKKDVIFTVTDTGIGVPKEQQKNLFTKFYRADNARHVRPDGTGLGIYLAKRVVDDHGGELVFHSAEGKGSTFGFKFPIKSKLSIKKVSAPAPASGATPAIGELAAGVGVPAEALEATQKEKPEPEIPKNDLDIAKAAGLEAPLPDSADAKEMAKEAQKEKAVSGKGKK